MDEYINITLDNIDEEHICCAIGDSKHQTGVNAKKEWLKKRILEGHVFRKLNERGKVFIEYAPLESAWTPIDGDGFMYIYCLWVAGSFKGKGHAKELLEYAIRDAKERGKKGICTISSKKKKPFLSEHRFFEHYGFEVVDTIGEYELLALSFDGSSPAFRECARRMETVSEEFTIYYSPECPYVVHSLGEVEKYATENGIPLKVVCIDSLDEAKNVPCVFNNWANFKDGKFVSNTILNANSFEKLVK